MMSTDNVVYPNKWKSNGRPAWRRRAESKAHVVENLKRDTESDRNMRLKDRIVVARNLYGILEESKKRYRVGKGEIAGHIFGRHNEVSRDQSKRLDKYTLSAKIEPGSRKERDRAQNLVQAPKLYRKVAEKAAELTGQSEDNVLFELFNGSSYLDPGAGDDADTMDPETPFVDSAMHFLAEAFETIASRVAAETGLRRYFSYLSRHGAPYYTAGASRWHLDVGHEPDQPTFMPLRLEPFQQPLERNELECLPSMRLYAELRHRAAAEALLDAGDGQENLVELAAYRDGADGSDESTGANLDAYPRGPAMVELWREVWLALAPSGDGEEVRPAFAWRNVFILRRVDDDPDDWEEEDDGAADPRRDPSPWGRPGGAIVFASSLLPRWPAARQWEEYPHPGGNVDELPDATGDIAWRIVDPKATKALVNHTSSSGDGTYRLEPLSPTSCRRYLHIARATPDQVLGAHCGNDWGFAKDPVQPPEFATESSSATVAEWVELTLYHPAQGRGFEDRLADEAKRLVGYLEAWLDRRREIVDRDRRAFFERIGGSADEGRQQ